MNYRAGRKIRVAKAVQFGRDIQLAAPASPTRSIEEDSPGVSARLPAVSQTSASNHPLMIHPPGVTAADSAESSPLLQARVGRRRIKDSR